MRANDLILPGLLLVALGGCQSMPLLQSPIAPPLPPAAPQVTVYQCEGERVTIRMAEEVMDLWWAHLPLERPLRLRPEVGGAETHYVGEALRVSIKGRRAVLTGADGVRRCQVESERRPWAEAWLRGVDFRAVGQEPDWQLELTEGGDVVIVSALGSQVARWPTAPSILIDGGWRRELEGLRIDWLDRPCEDVMSGVRHAATVRLVRGGETLQGCGERL